MESIEINQAIYNDTPIIRWKTNPSEILCDSFFTASPDNTGVCYKHSRPKFKIEVGGDILGIKGETLCRDCVVELSHQTCSMDFKIKENTTNVRRWFLVVALALTLYTSLIISLYYTMQPIE